MEEVGRYRKCILHSKGREGGPTQRVISFFCKGSKTKLLGVVPPNFSCPTLLLHILLLKKENPVLWNRKRFHHLPTADRPEVDPRRGQPQRDGRTATSEKRNGKLKSFTEKTGGIEKVDERTCTLSNKIKWPTISIILYW